MTTPLPDFALFAAAFAVAIATPGPFAAALVARGMAFGYPSAAGMAVGGLIGDAAFASVALFGLTLIAQQFEPLLMALRYIGAAWLIWLGLGLLRLEPRVLQAGAPGHEGAVRGWVAGATLSLGNPKAALFYLAVFPGYFDIPRLEAADIAAIYATIAIVLVGGHMLWAAAAVRAARLLRTPRALHAVNRLSGSLLAAAGVAIAVT